MKLWDIVFPIYQKHLGEKNDVRLTAEKDFWRIYPGNCMIKTCLIIFL